MSDTDVWRADFNRERRKLWRKAYVAAIRKGVDAIWNANEAVKQYDEQFKDEVKD